MPTNDTANHDTELDTAKRRVAKASERRSGAVKITAATHPWSLKRSARPPLPANTGKQMLMWNSRAGYVQFPIMYRPEVDVQIAELGGVWHLDTLSWRFPASLDPDLLAVVKEDFDPETDKKLDAKVLRQLGRKACELAQKKVDHARVRATGQAVGVVIRYAPGRNLQSVDRWGSLRSFPHIKTKMDTITAITDPAGVDVAKMIDYVKNTGTDAVLSWLLEVDGLHQKVIKVVRTQREAIGRGSKQRTQSRT